MLSELASKVSDKFFVYRLVVRYILLLQVVTMKLFETVKMVEKRFKTA